MRLGVYTDFPYRRDVEGLHGEQAFVLFVEALAPHVEGMTLIGREERGASWRGFRLGKKVTFAELPFYPSLASPADVIRALRQTCMSFWRTLDDLDAVWLMGPHPMAIAFALLALARGRKVILGVRQRLPAYVARRHPRKYGFRALAWVLELAFRSLALGCPTVVVGPDLVRGYRWGRQPLSIAVSLIDEGDVVSEADALAKSYEGELTAVSVGRLDPEKNPLLLAEVLAALRADDERWRLEVCGDGQLRDALEKRLDELGLAGHATIRGNVPFGPELMEVYRRGHALLHVSWTEGFPQVLIEAFAAGMPVVATDVGGVAAASANAARLISAGNAASAARELDLIARDAVKREALIRAGLRRAREMTLSHEVARLEKFITGS